LFDGRTSWLVHGYAKDQNWFFYEFAKSMEKMSRMGLGKAGEIRSHCSKRNVVKSSSMEEIDEQQGLAASA
jgi:peroxidase